MAIDYAAQVDEAMASIRVRLDTQYGAAGAEGDVAGALAALKPLLLPSEALTALYDFELGYATVTISSPYGGAAFSGEGRTLTAAIEAATAKVAARGNDR